MKHHDSNAEGMLAAGQSQCACAQPPAGPRCCPWASPALRMDLLPPLQPLSPRGAHPPHSLSAALPGEDWAPEGRTRAPSWQPRPRPPQDLAALLTRGPPSTRRRWRRRGARSTVWPGDSSVSGRDGPTSGPPGASVMETVSRSDRGSRRAGASLGSCSRGLRMDGMPGARVMLGAEDCRNVPCRGL